MLEHKLPMSVPAVWSAWSLGVIVQGASHVNKSVMDELTWVTDNQIIKLRRPPPCRGNSCLGPHLCNKWGWH